MKSIEFLGRISFAAIVLGGCAKVGQRNNASLLSPSIVQAGEQITPIPNEMEDRVLMQPELGIDFLEAPLEMPIVQTYPLDATTSYRRFASVLIDASGTRLFNKLTSGDPSFAVSPEDLPLFGKIWTAQNYIDTIRWFNVSDSTRYQAGGTGSYCNIFLWDVTSALGVEIPHYVNGIETDANWIYLWLTGEGQDSGAPSWEWGKASDLGWFEVTAEEAQKNANQGYPTVATMADPDAYSHGHVAVVIPGKLVVVNTTSYPLIAQAGARAFVGLSAYEGFEPWIEGRITKEPTFPRYFSIYSPYDLTHNENNLTSDQ